MGGQLQTGWKREGGHHTGSRSKDTLEAGRTTYLATGLLGMNGWDE